MCKKRSFCPAVEKARQRCGGSKKGAYVSEWVGVLAILQKMREGLFQASNNNVFPLFGAIVFALSLSMTQELPLCSVPPSTSIYFRVD